MDDNKKLLLSKQMDRVNSIAICMEIIKLRMVQQNGVLDADAATQAAAKEVRKTFLIATAITKEQSQMK